MIWTDVFGCIGNRSIDEESSSSTMKSKESGLQSLLGEELNVDGECKFCNPTSENFNIILEDEQFVVFTDRDPAAAFHLLAIPRTHVANTKNLRGDEGARLVEDLFSIGTKALNQMENTSSTSEPKDQRETRFGFHIPPFRSVDHLHLHCMALPFKSPFKALKYRIAPGDPPTTFKGWGWFVTAEQAIAILRAGRSIDVEPC